MTIRCARNDTPPAASTLTRHDASALPSGGGLTSSGWPRGSLVGIGVEQAPELLRLPRQLRALEARDLEERRQLPVELRQPQDLLDLLADPLVVGDRVGAARDEERLQELAERVVEAVERLEVQAPLDEERDVVEVVAAVAPHHAEPFRAQRVVVVGEPAG